MSPRALAAALLAMGAVAQQTIQANSFLVLRHGTTTFSPSGNVTAPIAVEEWALSDDGSVGTILQVSRGVGRGGGGLHGAGRACLRRTACASLGGAGRASLR